MTKKAPRRTAQRILETALELFNRFGEPHVSTTLLAAELRISPGNLYYHYAGKDALVNALFDRHAHALSGLLDASSSVRQIEDAWFFMHTLFEQMWQFRFLYRDLNELLSRNRHLETHFQPLLVRKVAALRTLLGNLGDSGALQQALAQAELQATATNMAVVLCYWLSFEYVRDPRHALEPTGAQSALLRGAQQVLHLLTPYLAERPRAHLRSLAQAYAAPWPAAPQMAHGMPPDAPLFAGDPSWRSGPPSPTETCTASTPRA
ncbi:TetR/AcrR family transcriptional regulator [Extensimonas perlucida]|uniref:TetR/AcrR family transcriptional regulator n=1 Tax=Extensimonas perlucida TaxID=2590786 RepID=UPI0011A3D906